MVCTILQAMFGNGVLINMMNDIFKMKKTGSSINPKGSNDYFDPTEPYVEKHILRGGSYLCNEVYCSGYRVARRMSADKTSSYNHTGFRCVKDVEKSI